MHEHEPARPQVGVERTPQKGTGARPAALSGALGASHILALQRAAGNRAMAQLLGAPSIPAREPIVQRETNDPGFTPAEKKQYRDQISAGRASTKTVSTKFSTFMDTSNQFVKAFRDKADWVNGSYGLGYQHHSTLVKTLAADDATRQVIANLVVSLGLNLLTGGIGELLEGAKVLSNSAAYWFDQISNSAVGVPGAPDVQISKVNADADPAFKELMGLRTLDQLHEVILPLATTGSRNLLSVMTEAGDLTEALDADKPAIAKADFATRMAKLQKSFDLLPQSTPTFDKAMATFADLWATFYKSPWPDDRRSEQDIWIAWLSTQVTSNESWSAAAFGSTAENYKLTDHLADIGVSGKETAGGRLGVSAKPDWKLKAAAQAQVPEVAKYWASVFLQ